MAGTDPRPDRRGASRHRLLRGVPHPARTLQAKIGRARRHLLAFLDRPGMVEVTDDGSGRLPRPAVLQRQMTDGYRAMWAASDETDIRTVVDTARLTGIGTFATILKAVGA